MVSWSDWSGLPTMDELYVSLRTTPSTPRVNTDKGDVEQGLASAVRAIHSTYLYPFQAHGSIGPSCAVADVNDDHATIWSPTANPHGARAKAANILGLPLEAVHVVYLPGSGSYGSNGADDATMDAAVISQTIGRPVRL